MKELKKNFISCLAGNSLCLHYKAQPVNAVYFENDTLWLESTSQLYRPGDRRLPAKLVPTICGYAAWSHIIIVRTSQETQYIYATKTSRLTMFKETAPFSRGTHTEHTNPIRILRLRHKAQPVNGVLGSSRCLL
jgi:hypothetical protein